MPALDLKGNGSVQRRTGGWLGDFKAYNPNPEEARLPSTSWSGSWATPLADEGATHVGADQQGSGAEQSRQSQQLQRREPVIGKAGILILAFVVPLALTFIAETWDKSALIYAKAQAAGFPAAAMFGYALSTALAVGIGYIFERQLSERRLLFSIVLALLSMAAVSTSVAVLEQNGNVFEASQVHEPALLSTGQFGSPVPAQNASFPKALLLDNNATRSAPSVRVVTRLASKPLGARAHDAAKLEPVGSQAALGEAQHEHASALNQNISAAGESHRVATIVPTKTNATIQIYAPARLIDTVPLPANEQQTSVKQEPVPVKQLPAQAVVATSHTAKP